MNSSKIVGCSPEVSNSIGSFVTNRRFSPRSDWKQFDLWTTTVRDDPKLLDDGGYIPKSQGRGWQFDSML